MRDGTLIKLSGHRDKVEAEQIAKNIDLLDRAKTYGELPPASLMRWIEGLSEEVAARYVSLGLLERRLVDRRRPIEELLSEHLNHTKLHCKARSPVPCQKVERIRRVFSAINSTTSFKDLTPDVVLGALNGFRTLSGKRKGQFLSRKTLFEYVTAMKSFGEWMVKTGRAASNPLQDMRIIAPRGAPVRNRRPLSVAEFSTLMSYPHSTSETYPHQLYNWTSLDRLMIYWMAVMTGFRMNELRSLTRSDVYLESNPALVTVEG